MNKAKSSRWHPEVIIGGVASALLMLIALLMLAPLAILMMAPRSEHPMDPAGLDIMTVWCPAAAILLGIAAIAIGVLTVRHATELREDHVDAAGAGNQ